MSEVSTLDTACPQCGVEPHEGTRFCSNCRFPLMLIAQKYRLMRQIGQGGSGLLFEALHTGLARHPKRAIKFIRPEVLGLEGMARRFRQEVEVTAELSRHNHHIVQIYDDFGEVLGLGVFYVMELLEGRTLRQMIRQQGALPLYLILHLMTQLLEAMEHVHQAGIVHRDLKPENLFLVERDGDPHYLKVIDFGLLKDTETSSSQTHVTQGMMGTPAYMSPEQCLNHPVDIRSDIYSMSVIFYELLSGRLPFPQIRQVGSVVEVMQIHLMGTPIPLGFVVDLPQELIDLVMMGLARDPYERVPSAKEYLSRLAYLRPSLAHLEREKIADLVKDSSDAVEMGGYTGRSSQAEVFPKMVVQEGDHLVASQQRSEAASVTTWHRKHVEEPKETSEAFERDFYDDPSIPSDITGMSKPSSRRQAPKQHWFLWVGLLLGALVGLFSFWHEPTVLHEGSRERHVRGVDGGVVFEHLVKIPEEQVVAEVSAKEVAFETPHTEQSATKDAKLQNKAIAEVKLLPEETIERLWKVVWKQRTARRALRFSTYTSLREKLASASAKEIAQKVYDGIEATEEPRVAFIYLQAALSVLREKVRQGKEIRSYCRALWLRPLLLFRQRVEVAPASLRPIMRRYEQAIVSCQRIGPTP